MYNPQCTQGNCLEDEHKRGDLKDPMHMQLTPLPLNGV